MVGLNLVWIHGSVQPVNWELRTVRSVGELNWIVVLRPLNTTKFNALNTSARNCSRPRSAEPNRSLDRQVQVVCLAARQIVLTRLEADAPRLRAGEHRRHDRRRAAVAATIALLNCEYWSLEQPLPTLPRLGITIRAL